MRLITCVCGLVALFASSAIAQSNPSDSVLLASSTPVVTADPSPAGAPVASIPASGAYSASAPAASAGSAQFGGPPATPDYNWQVYIGYTFVRFYELPKVIPFPNGLTFNSNGLNIEGVHYFRSLNWVALEGDAVGTYGSVPSSKFALVGGGARVRWQAPHDLELWAHMTLDLAHILPQTSFGGQTSFAYQIGGGVDYFTHFNIGARVETDLIGTHFFSTYQRSIQLSAGVVYRF